MKKTALGRGLSALMPEQNGNNGEELRQIEIDQIEPNLDQPRTRFDENALEELTQSIRENGIVQPIVVRRKENGNFEIVAGERRWRAAQKAGLTTVPAVVREVSDDKMLELALIENIQRHELNAMEEARAYKKLIDTLGLTQEMVATRVGKDRTFITSYLRLLKLPEDVQKLVEDEKISVGHARALLMADAAETQRQIARSILDDNLNVRETERAIKRLATNGNASKSQAKTLQSDANVRAAETKLARKFGTKVTINSKADKLGGTIAIEFYSDDDLQRIYEQLMKNDE